MKLSHWAWGYEDKRPDGKAEVAQASAVLGFTPTEAETPVPLEQAEMPDSRLECDLPFVRTDRRDRALHTRGKGWFDQLRSMRGDFRTAPDLVAHPTTEAEVEQVLAWADAQDAAVIPFGGGTNIVRGTEFDGGGFSGVVSLDLKGLNQVLEVDRRSRAARIQGGATGPVLEEQLAKHGLTLRHYPQSFVFSTLGGWIATRAGGHYATRATHIDEFVESVRMITPSGTWASRRLPGSGAGPSPDRLVCGSEGTLGVITEAWMRVMERPRWRSKAAVHFDDWDAAVDAVHEISQCGVWPANCRLLDRGEAMVNAVAFGSHVLLLGFESAHHPVETDLDRVLAIALRHGGTCPEGPKHRDSGERIAETDTANTWREGFFAGPYRQSALMPHGVLVDVFETACTWDAFPALHEGVRAAVTDVLKATGDGAAFVTCRFTHVYPDGPAPYYTFFTKADRGNELEQWERIKTAASDAVLRHGGTITHHHAVGRTHRPWYDKQLPDLFRSALTAAKGVVDPGGRLNPGVLVDPR